MAARVSDSWAGSQESRERTRGEKWRREASRPMRSATSCVSEEERTKRRVFQRGNLRCGRKVDCDYGRSSG
jgi:hypothetical protein